jgi:hypothetical protein
MVRRTVRHLPLKNVVRLSLIFPSLRRVDLEVPKAVVVVFLPSIDGCPDKLWRSPQSGVTTDRVAPQAATIEVQRSPRCTTVFPLGPPCGASSWTDKDKDLLVPHPVGYPRGIRAPTTHTRQRSTVEVTFVGFSARLLHVTRLSRVLRPTRAERLTGSGGDHPLPLICVG